MDMVHKEVQRESWKQGCRAVFAGFVASAHPRGLPANIDMFWLTEQKDTILPSLRSLDPDPDNRRDKVEEEVRAKRALHILLSDPGNGLTKSKEKDELEITVRWREIEWALTSKGRKMFPLNPFDTSLPLNIKEGIE